MKKNITATKVTFHLEFNTFFIDFHLGFRKAHSTYLLKNKLPIILTTKNITMLSFAIVGKPLTWWTMEFVRKNFLNYGFGAGTWNGSEVIFQLFTLLPL